MTFVDRSTVERTAITLPFDVLSEPLPVTGSAAVFMLFSGSGLLGLVAIGRGAEVLVGIVCTASPRSVCSGSVDSGVSSNSGCVASRLGSCMVSIMLFLNDQKTPENY